MGNPLSPLLSDIFMDHLETKISKHPVLKQFLYWWRYVDDVLECFTGTNRQLDQFLSHIEFTRETEQNQSINFLDIKIIRLKNKHDFSIFHKPTHTDTTIHNSSSHTTQIPMSNYNFETELNIIKQIAVNNGYNEQTINKI
ncbi:unnamed protein product [Diabrotica balteata]|uniref:Reverse transcriptase domain-containing protein n=1 Tax=Diabrotica balteata TaxID=107213 RepID=A0A9N9SS96_DIABA|nr:unnamed protein product [Diabrotica balteata]